MMINYKISEQLKNQLDNLSHDKYDKIKNFLQELLNPKKNSKYHTEFQNFLGWIDSPEFMLKQLEGINDFINMSKEFLLYQRKKNEFSKKQKSAEKINSYIFTDYSLK